MVTLYDVTKPITGTVENTLRYLGWGKRPERFKIKPSKDGLEALVSTDRGTTKQVAKQIEDVYNALQNKDARISSVGTCHRNQTDYVTVSYNGGENRAYPITQMGGFFIMKELITLGNECLEENDRNFIRILSRLLAEDESSPIKAA